MVCYDTPLFRINPSHKMLKRGGVFVLATCFQVITAQRDPPPFLANLPEECRHPPRDVRIHECCDIPKIIDESKFVACGIEEPLKGDPPSDKPRNIPEPPDCSKGLCLLRNEGLLDDDDKIKYTEAAEFLDGWSETHPEFEESVKYAKEQCIKEGGPPGPPHVCEATRFLFCISGNVFYKCPKWNETVPCQNLKSHMEKCEKYFMKRGE